MTAELALLTNTALDAITDAIIDHSSLFRLVTGLKTAVASPALSTIIEHLQQRVLAVAAPVVLDSSAVSTGDITFDLVISMVLSPSPAALLRPGGILALLRGMDEPHATVATDQFRSILSEAMAPGLYLELYQKVEYRSAPTLHSYGVVLSRSLYDGILSAGAFAFPTCKWSLLVGRSGVGKTTVLELTSGLRTSPHAKILQAGGRSFYLPQDAEPITGVTVDTNIALFASSREVVESITTRLNLQAVRARSVDKTLSGGERQRVVIGQALASRADVMLMDEPSSGLDQVRRTQMFHYLKAGDNPPPTLLCVAHDFAPITDYFDHVFEILNGTLVKHY